MLLTFFYFHFHQIFTLERLVGQYCWCEKSPKKIKTVGQDEIWTQMADEFLYHAQNTRIKTNVCDVKGSKQDYFHRNNFILRLPSWTNFLRVQSLSLCSLANVSCMPNSNFCRWQQATWWLIYIVRESRLEKIVRFLLILFNTFKCSSFTCMYSVNLWI